MGYEKFEKNIIDMLIEQQLKLGFMEESVRLYYPLSSLSVLLDKCDTGTDSFTIDAAEAALREFKEEVKDRLGEISFERKKDRFCIVIPKEGGQYVHDHMPEKLFIKDLIELVAHHCNIEEIIDLFNNNSDAVHIEEVSDNDFKYLIYFEKGIPDDYYYCFNIEGEHVIYHRYTKKDYLDLFE